LKGALSEKGHHFHLGAFDCAEVEMQDDLYRPTDTIVGSAVVIFRTNEQDRNYVPTDPRQPTC
jgi:hypothetical protein